MLLLLFHVQSTEAALIAFSIAFLVAILARALRSFDYLVPTVSNCLSALPDQFSNCSCKEIILFINLPKKFIKSEIPTHVNNRHAQQSRMFRKMRKKNSHEANIDLDS